MPPTWDEAAAAVGQCKFCSMLSTKRCDGKLESGAICNNKICDSHARTVAVTRVQRRFGQSVCQTRDLCPECVEAGRTLGFHPVEAP